MLLYFQILSTLYLEANHKVPSSRFQVLSMSESDFSELVTPHETAFVNIAVYSVESALTRILPHFEISTIAQYRDALRILGNHQLVAVELAQKIVVIEIGSRIDEGFLLVCFLYEMQKLKERIAEFFCIHAAFRLHINHRQEVLISWTALGHEIFQLRLLWDAGSVEMIRTYFHSVAMSQVNILLVFAVDVGSALGSFQINVSHLRVVAHGFPEHVALIMTQVDAVNVPTSVFALHLCMGSQGNNGCYNRDK